MAFSAVRPRFRLTVPGTVDHQIACLQAVVGEPTNRVVGRVLGTHMDITVIREDRHRWSPCVHLDFRQEEAETVIDGLLGPHPNTWTLFAFINITLATIGMFGLMTGLAQLSLGLSAWGFWVVLGSIFLLGVMYLASQAGQRLAADQSRHLTEVIEQGLGRPIHAPSDA